MAIGYDKESPWNVPPNSARWDFLQHVRDNSSSHTSRLSPVSSSSAIAVAGVIVPCTREQRHETDGQGWSFMLDPFIRRNLNATDSRRSNRFALFKRKMRICTSPSGFVPYFPSPSVIALPNVFRLLCRPECLESVTSLPSSSGRSWSA